MVTLSDVLVVDDSPTMRSLVSFALISYGGCRVTEAGNGVEALERLSQRSCDLMVVDINMPEMNGLELIRAVRSDNRLRHIPIVVLTTEDGDDDIRRGIAAGATEYLVKPFQPWKLHQIISRIFGVEAFSV